MNNFHIDHDLTNARNYCDLYHFQEEEMKRLLKLIKRKGIQVYLQEIKIKTRK